MSKVYFHTPSGDAQIRGSERAWLSHVAAGPGTYAWDFDRVGADCSRAYGLVELMATRGLGDYASGDHLKDFMTWSKVADERYAEACRQYREAGSPGGVHAHPRFDPEPGRRFIDALKTNLRVSGFPIQVAGHRLHTDNITLNTALVAGSDPVALAAKIHGWCELHAWFEGEHRDWLAGIIEQGLQAGIYRRGIWYDMGEGKEREWASQGWEELVPFLRARDDEPVVMSYSVGDQFPNRSEVDWTPPELPADWMPEFWEREDWDALGENERQEYREDQGPEEQWYALPAAEQWRIAMDSLRRDKPWARIGPDTLREVTFSKSVTVYDLFAPDRDERVARAFAQPEKEESVKPLPVSG